MTTKIPVELSSTPGIADSSNATAITIDSSENISINSGDVTLATASKRYYVPRASDAAATGSLYSPANSDIRLSGAGSSAGTLSFEPSSSSGVAMFMEADKTVHIGGSYSYSAGAAVLHLHQADATSNAYLHITQEDGGSTSSDGMSIGVLDGGANAVMRLRENGFLAFYTNNTEQMRIGSAGQVMINTTSSGNRALNVTQLIDGETGLYVNNTTATVTSSFAPLAQLQFSGDADVGDGTKYIEFQRQSDTIGSITALGAAVQYNTSSDRNLKENIVDASSQLNLIKNLQVREFDWKTDSRHDVGLIAQELHEHIPNIVTVGSDKKDVRGFTTPWSIDYGKLTPYLVKAIQEQQEQIEQLKTEIQTLKGE